MTKDQWMIDGSGELVRYPDPYGEVTPERVARAEDLEAFILLEKAKIEQGFYRLAGALASFEDERLFLARGYPTFREWADSPEIGISYRTAHDLTRIARELLPLVNERGVGADAAQLGIATMRALLPMLADEDGEEKVAALIPEIVGLATRDAQQRIKEVRGLAKPLEDGQPAIFKAHVTRGETFHTVRIACSDGLDYYDVGTLRIKRVHWPRWENRFGAFVEVAG